MLREPREGGKKGKRPNFFCLIWRNFLEEQTFAMSLERQKQDRKRISGRGNGVSKDTVL